MPEGDVVRLTAARLAQALAGRRLGRVELRWPGVDDATFLDSTVTTVAAYGKHLLVRVDTGATLHTHLRMEGSWYVARSGSDQAVARSPYVRAVLGNDTWTAVGYRLGMLDVVRTRDEHSVIGHLGPDILADDLTVDTGLVRAHLLRDDPDVTVAEALLDQTRLAGIGTIFASESLFVTRLSPWLNLVDVPEPALAAVLAAARDLMQRSVSDGLGSRARLVHGRAGRPCVRCGTTVVVRQARRPPFERPIFFCPGCQCNEPGWRPQPPPRVNRPA